jgi:hypothetical protein
MGNEQHSTLSDPEGRDRPTLRPGQRVFDGSSSVPPVSDVRPVAAKQPAAVAPVSPARAGFDAKWREPTPESDAPPSSGTFRSSLPYSVDSLVADLPKRRAPSAEQAARRARLQRIVVAVLATFGLFDVAVVLWLILR